MKRQRHCVWTSLIGGLLTATTLLAQGTTSRVTGTVTDQSAALIPDATVLLTNEATNVNFTTHTTSSGTYVFDSIQVGTYALAVEKSGFKKSVSSGNVLSIGEPMTVNVTLQVGEVAQSVEVHGTAELVQTSTSGNFGNVVSQRSIQELPIVGSRGRNPLNFTLFQPGVSVCDNCAGGGVNVNGSRDRAWNFTLDGVDINETSAGGSSFSPLRTNPDMLSEFRVITGNATAEFGRNSGAQVTMVTRTGGNQFHGNLFEFYQTPRFQANQYFNNLQGLPKSQFVQHIYGFSVGGPIRKNKTFFFTNMQFLHTRQTRGVTSTVYTDSARRGIFRYVAGGRNFPAGAAKASVDSSGNVLAGVKVTPYDIAGKDPQKFGLDPDVQKILGMTPLPNNFTVGDGLNVAGYSWTPRQFEQQVDEVVRLDHTFNDRNNIFGRWASGHQNTLGDFVNAGWARFPGTPRVVDTFRKPRNLAIGWRTVPSSNTTNELVLGMNRFIFNFANADPKFQSQPQWALNNVTMPVFNYVGNLRALTTAQLSDNFTYVRGAHTFKTGINFRFQRHIDRRGSVAGFNVQPSADLSSGINTVDPVAFGLPGNIEQKFDRPRLQNAINDLLGRVGSINEGFVAAGDQFAQAGSVYSFDSRFPEYDFYGQDTWKLRPNLTIDLGLRWEVNLSPGDPRNRIARPDQPFVVGAPPSNTLKWLKGPLYQKTYGDLGPSIGIAWDPFGTGKTSIRANYRLAYDRINTFSLSSAIFQNLPGQTLGVENRVFGQNGGRIRDGIPVLAPPPGKAPNQLTQPQAFSTSGITVINPEWRPPKVNEWELSIQRQLVSNMVFSMSYVGRHGVGLFGAYDANQVDISNNGFLQAFQTVAAGGDSSLMNQLYSADPNRKAGQTGSQRVRELFPSVLALGSVASLAQSINQTQVKGVSLPVASGFSPYFFVPYPQFSGGVNVLDSNDVSTYHALQIQLDRRLSTGLTFQASYTLSKSLDTRSFDPTFTIVGRGATQSASGSPYEIHNRRLNYAPSDFDVRHAFQGMTVWPIPLGAGRHWGGGWNPVLQQILGGWQTAGIWRWTSGRPFTVYSGAFTVSNVVQSPADCPGCPGDMGSLTFDSAAGTLYLFDAAQRARFVAPAPGKLGRGRNAFRLPGYFNVDLALEKETRITERQRLEFRLEMTNATNHPNFDLPDSSIFSSTTFGRERNGVVNNARAIQLGLKYNF